MLLESHRGGPFYRESIRGPGKLEPTEIPARMGLTSPHGLVATDLTSPQVSLGRRADFATVPCWSFVKAGAMPMTDSPLT